MLRHDLSNTAFRLLFLGLIVVAAGCRSTEAVRQSPALQDSSVVAVFGDEVLTLDTFEERYVRSRGSREAAAGDSLGAYQDFLERYVNFRLKVMAAQAAGMNDAPDLLSEINTYRTNLARPYLLEQAVLEPIILDLYQKQQEMVDASHILIRASYEDSPADTLAAYNRIAALVDSVRQGADFGDLAFRYSEDPSASNSRQGPGYRGRLGFFSAGRMVQPFEDMAYATPVGEVSSIFRTQFGYHILYVHDRQPARSDVHVSHIMVQPAMSAEDSLAKRQLIEDLKARIEAGEDFATLARQYSVDKGSAAKGGDLGFIAYDMPIVASFKDAAFALQEPGELSDLVETPFGFHLIKLHERKPRPTLEEAYTELKQTAARMPRARQAEKALADEILAREGAQIDTAFVLQTLTALPADSLFHKLVSQELPAAAGDHVILTLADSTYTLDDMAVFARGARVERSSDATKVAMDILGQFTTKQAIDYEAATLEQRDEAFSQIMDEFRDGLLLFKLMEDSVWTAAEQDSAALLAYYEAHADEYTFPERTRIIGFHAASDSLMKRLVQRLEAGEAVAALQAELAADTLHHVQLDTVLVAGPTNAVYDRALALQEGQHTQVLANRGRYSVLIHAGQVPPGPKSFEDARAEVVSAYQKVLEAQLLESLRARYDVRTFPQRLTRAFGEAAAAPPAQAPVSAAQ